MLFLNHFYVVNFVRKGKVKLFANLGPWSTCRVASNERLAAEITKFPPYSNMAFNLVLNLTQTLPINMQNESAIYYPDPVLGERNNPKICSWPMTP